MTEEIVARHLNEFDFFHGEKIEKGTFLEVSEVRRKALMANPYRESEAEVCEWVGFADGKPAGFNYCFPIRVLADGVSYRSATGSSLNVEEWARKTSLGLILPSKGVEVHAKDGIAIAASCSQMAIPVHQINGYKYFIYPRYIALWHSRCVLEMMLPRVLAKVAGWFVDCGIYIYVALLKMVASCKMRGYQLVRAEPNDESTCETMAKIVSGDARRFREDHDAAWFKWHLNNSFSSDGPCVGWLLKRKHDDAAVGFGLTKRRFYKQASHRGFKNVWLGSIMEWGATTGNAKLEKGLVLSLALKTAGNCDACDFSTAEPQLGAFARHIGWQHVGDTNVGIKVMKNFPLFGDKALRDVANWRIRPAMGDNGLS